MSLPFYITSNEESEEGCSDDESDTESSSDISIKQSGTILLDTSVGCSRQFKKFLSTQSTGDQRLETNKK